MGSAHTDIEYETDAHTFYISATAAPMKKLDLSAMLSYTLGKGEMDGIYFAADPFDTSVLNACPTTTITEYSATYVNGSESYSDLDYKMWEVNLAASYQILKNLGLTVSYWYADFNDDEEYVYGDLDGDAYSLSTFLTYTF